MFKIDEYVVYKKDVCIIKDIIKKNDIDYYVLSPLDDNSLKLIVPMSNNKLLRKLISKDEVNNIIKNICNIPTIDCDDKFIEQEYKEKMKSGKHEDLISIIKTTYLRNNTRKNEKKKISEKDDYYFNRAEKYLYYEFSVVLGMNYEDTKKYVIDKVMEYGG